MSRIDRINQTMRREIGTIIQRELQDPRLSFVTITQVEVSRDLQHAKAYFSVLGDHPDIEKAQASLNNARGIVRKLVGKSVRMRYTPEIQFIFDASIQYSAHLEETFQQIHDQTQGEKPEGQET